MSVEALLAEWESIIRKLLRIRVDIHAPVPRGENLGPHYRPCNLSPYGTPLDELFEYTRTSGEANDAADAWLYILSTEGIDVLTYLEKENNLHDTWPRLTYPRRYMNYMPRQLVFSLGEAPVLYADWWIDPESSASLIRHEFRDMNAITTDFYNLGRSGWQGYCGSEWILVWPIRFPRWSDELEPDKWSQKKTEEHKIWVRLKQRAQERADRRWQQRAKKTARLNGTQARLSMPGAWLE